MRPGRWLWSLGDNRQEEILVSRRRENSISKSQVWTGGANQSAARAKYASLELVKHPEPLIDE
jgi:hypothetical protein